MLFYVAVSILTGVIIVVSRIFNTKLSYKMGKVADVVNNIIDHIKNGSGGGINFTPGKPLELTEEKVYS